jgi:hypothetical protein
MPDGGSPALYNFDRIDPYGLVKLVWAVIGR